MSSAPIAVVGLASILPGSNDIAGFWETVREARDCFSDVPESHWRIEDYYDPTPRAKDKTYGRRGGFVTPQPFDTLSFGIPPTSLPSTDVAQLLALLASQRCIADADHGAAPRFDRARCSVILGAATATQLGVHMSARMGQPMWRQGMRNAGFDETSVERACAAIADQFVPWQESTFPGLLSNVIAGRIANRFDLRGTNCAIDAACASSLAAVAMGMDELRNGRADTVITGGVDAANDILMFISFSQTPALSPTGNCRPFSEDADGTMLGEGVAMLALRRLEDAERDGHKIYAVLRGVGTSSDGRARSVYAPRAEGQALALERAYSDAGYSPATVELVEAHGTGTTAGDAAEAAALRSVFGAAAHGGTQWCALGSVKSQIGHTKGAAGAASLVKAVLALQHRTLPPTLQVSRPDPALELAASPFYVSTESRPWFRRSGHPRRAGVSSFGFGGSNFHVTLEEYTGAAVAPRSNAGPVHLILLASDSASELHAKLGELSARIHDTAQLAAFAKDSQQAFVHSAPMRLALSAADVVDLANAVMEAHALCDMTGEVQRSARTVMRRSTPAGAAEVAFLFPGQGSQYIGMGRDLALQWPDALAVWERAASHIRDGTTDLGEVVFPRPAFERADRDALEARLRATAWAQPALAAASLAQLALLDRIGLVPRATAGHSFGELVALHAAGAYDASALLAIARARGEAMAACTTAGGDAGAMIAVAADVATVQALLDRVGDRRVVVANDNHPRQTVLSGPAASLQALVGPLADAGLSHQPLPVAAAFHSPLIAPAASRFAAAIAAMPFGALRFPVVANETARPYESDALAVRTRLANQLSKPVRFRESVDALYGLGCRIFVEVGAGNVLSGLVDKCLVDRPHVTIALDNRDVHGTRSWWAAMAELATLGLPVRLANLQPDVPAFDLVPIPPSGPTVVAVGGANFGKPYPPPRGTEVPRNDHEVNDPMDDESSSLLLEAQRLTQQAILESFAMTVRSLTGNGEATATPVTLRPATALPATPPPLPRIASTNGSASGAPALTHGPTHGPTHGNGARANGASVSTIAAPAVAVSRSLVVPPSHAIAPRAQVIPAPPANAAPSTAAMVLSVIAEKTGYPVEALAPDLEFEADLGIDSIKRVEILAALKDKLPALDPKAFYGAKMRSVNDLLVLLKEGPPADPGSPLDR